LRWLLERVEAVRRAATGRDAAKADLEDAEEPSVSSIEPTDTTHEIDDVPRPRETDTHADLTAALARSEPLHLRDCELEVSLSGLAEFDKCPRRDLLTHVARLDAPAHGQRDALRGRQPLACVPPMA